MGMCAVTCFCPCCCVAGTGLFSVPACCKPSLTFHPVWLVAAVVAFLAGLSVYVDLTFKCYDLWRPSCTWEPAAGTGVWVSDPPDGSARMFITDSGVWLPRPGEGHVGEILVNFTANETCTPHTKSWSLSPLAYEGNGCWSEGGNSAGAYFNQGLFTSLLLSMGLSMLLMSACTKLSEKTQGGKCFCTGRDIYPPELAAGAPASD